MCATYACVILCLLSVTSPYLHRTRHNVHVHAVTELLHTHVPYASNLNQIHAFLTCWCMHLLNSSTTSNYYSLVHDILL